MVLSRYANTPTGQKLIDAYGTPLFTAFLNDQYQKALALPAVTPDEQNLRFRALDALQMTEYLRFGKARELPGITTPQGQPQSPSENPEVAQLRQRAERAEQQLTQQRNTAQGSLVTQVNQTAKTSAMTDIGKLFDATGLSKVYIKEVLDPLKQSLYDQIHGMVSGSNGVHYDRGGWQTYQIQLAEMGNTANPNPSQPAETYRRMFRNVLQTHPDVKARLIALVNNAKSQSDTRIVQQTQAQTRTEPNGTGTPAPASVLPNGLQRQSGESTADFNQRRIAFGLQRTGMR